METKREQEMFFEQAGKCAICDEPLEQSSMRFDQARDTGRPRGILCDSCKWGLGQFEDNPDRLRDAAMYLELFA